MAESSSNPSSSTPAPLAEIDLGPSKMDQFLDNHQTKLIIAAILIALGVVAYVIYQGLAEAEAQEAGSALLGAKEPAEYQSVIKTWPESNAAASARLLLADLQWSDSQPDSIATLEEFISKYPQHPTVGTAKVSLGLRLLDQGKTAQASEILNEVADDDSYAYIAPLACIALGDIAKAAGKTTDATKWYEKAQEDASGLGNNYLDIASNRLLLVNARPPEKVKPALPAPPKPALAPAATTPNAPAKTQQPATKLSPPLLEKPDAPEPATKDTPKPPAKPAPAKAE